MTQCRVEVLVGCCCCGRCCSAAGCSASGTITQWAGSSGTVYYSGQEASDPPLALYNTVEGKLQILLWHCIMQWTGNPPLALYNTVDGSFLWHCIIQWKFVVRTGLN